VQRVYIVTKEAIVVGKLIIISGLSGSGKTTLVEHALSLFPNGTKVISCTTREKRPDEQDGVHYRFFSRKDFNARKKLGEFAEHKPSVYGNMYGTRKEDIAAVCSVHSPVFLVVDIAGAETLGELYPHAYKIFIIAKTEELTVRLEERNASPQDIEKRIATTKHEIAKMRKQRFDVVIENNNGKLDEVKKRFCSFIQNAIDGLTSTIP
jgi:guanylate kinase